MHHIRPAFPFAGTFAGRVLFNTMLKRRSFSADDVVIGIDADGYAIASASAHFHVAAIKGIIGDVIEFEKPKIQRQLVRHARLEQRHAQRANLVVVPSRYSQRRIETLYGVRAIAIPEPISLDAWLPALERHKHERRKRTQGFVVLCVCRFYPRKDVGTLLRAAASLVPLLPGLTLRIVGSGPEEGDLRRLANELRLGPSVQWLGNIDNDSLVREYGHADVFCLPSLQEGFGLVFLEAMAAGLPIVAVNAGAAPEVAKFGLLVPKRSPAALAEALLALANDPGRRSDVAEAGFDHVTQYDAPKVAQLFVETVLHHRSALAASRM